MPKIRNAILALMIFCFAFVFFDSIYANASMDLHLKLANAEDDDNLDNDYAKSLKIKKYNLSICAIFKNESHHLKEWIEYHRLIGVDHFYLYNIKSSDDFYSILEPYIEEGLVTFIDWFDAIEDRNEHQPFVWTLSTKISAYENALILLARETKWLCFLDIQEFLVSSHATKLFDLLQKFDNYPGIILSNDFFDASQLDKFGEHLIIEATELSNPPPTHLHKQVMKMIVKPDLCKEGAWSPYMCKFKNKQRPLVVRRRDARINHYLNRDSFYLNLGKIKRKLHVDSRMLSEEETMELLDEGYAIEDRERAIYQFIPELYKKMGFFSEWGNLDYGIVK